MPWFTSICKWGMLWEGQDSRDNDAFNVIPTLKPITVDPFWITRLPVLLLLMVQKSVDHQLIDRQFIPLFTRILKSQVVFSPDFWTIKSMRQLLGHGAVEHVPAESPYTTSIVYSAETHLSHHLSSSPSWCFIILHREHELTWRISHSSQIGFCYISTEDSGFSVPVKNISKLDACRDLSLGIKVIFYSWSWISWIRGALPTIPCIF